MEQLSEFQCLETMRVILLFSLKLMNGDDITDEIRRIESFYARMCLTFRMISITQPYHCANMNHCAFSLFFQFLKNSDFQSGNSKNQLLLIACHCYKKTEVGFSFQIHCKRGKEEKKEKEKEIFSKKKKKLTFFLKKKKKRILQKKKCDSFLQRERSNREGAQLDMMRTVRSLWNAKEIEYDDTKWCEVLRRCVSYISVIPDRHQQRNDAIDYKMIFKLFFVFRVGLPISFFYDNTNLSIISP